MVFLVHLPSEAYRFGWQFCKMLLNLGGLDTGQDIVVFEVGKNST